VYSGVDLSGRRNCAVEDRKLLSPDIGRVTGNDVDEVLPEDTCEEATSLVSNKTVENLLSGSVNRKNGKSTRRS